MNAQSTSATAFTQPNFDPYQNLSIDLIWPWSILGTCVKLQIHQQDLAMSATRLLRTC